MQELGSYGLMFYNSVLSCPFLLLIVYMDPALEQVRPAGEAEHWAVCGGGGEEEGGCQTTCLRNIPLPNSTFRRKIIQAQAPPPTHTHPFTRTHTQVFLFDMWTDPTFLVLFTLSGIMGYVWPSVTGWIGV